MGLPCLCVQRASGQVNGALVSSREHSVSLFFSVRSLTRTVNLSLSVNFSFLSWLKLFLTVSIYFHLISSCLAFPISFWPFSVSCPISSLCLFRLSLPLSLPPSAAFSIYTPCLFHETDLFKYQKADQEAWSTPFCLISLPLSY